MANEILVKTGTQLVFADHGTDFAGGAAKTSIEVSGTDVQLDLTGVADGAAREGDKFDFGATWAKGGRFMAALEFAATPDSGGYVNLYIAPSPISTAANGNVMSIDGADAAAPSGDGTLAELLAAIGAVAATFPTTDDPTGVVQVINGAEFFPTARYGIPIVENQAGAAFHSDAVEIHIVWIPNVDEVQ